MKRRWRSSPVRIHPEELLPDVTRRLGQPIRYYSEADRRKMAKLARLLAGQVERRAA